MSVCFAGLGAVDCSEFQPQCNVKMYAYCKDEFNLGAPKIYTYIKNKGHDS